MKRKLISILIVLILVLSAAGLGLVLYNNSKTVKVPDFNNQTLTDVKNWCDSLKDKGCIFNYEYSDTVEESHVIYQSIKADEKLEDSISFIISKGKEPSIALLEITKDTTKEDVEKWLGTVNITNVVYEYVNSDTVEEGKVIQIIPSTAIVNENTTLTVYISEGKEDGLEMTDDGLEIESGTFVGLSEESFKLKAEKLTLKANHKESRDAYSDTVEKGKIVWHGSGTFVKDETFNYGLSLGKKESSAKTVTVSEMKYVGLTLDQFKTKAEELGLKINHKESKDAYSDTVEKGNIVWHGTGEYDLSDSTDTFNYGLSLGKKDSEQKTVVVSEMKYVGLTLEQFKAKADELGLKVNHKETKDAYSNTVEKGSIVWHGTGTYDLSDETDTFNYGLSLGKKDSSEKTVVVSEMKYVGLTEEQFKAKANELGLKPNHKTSLDSYSSTIAKGSVVWHGTGTYDLSDPTDTFNYGLSLGSKTSESENIENEPTQEKVSLAANAYVNKAVSELTTFCTNNGLVAKYSSSYDDYSSTVTAGNIITHDSGSIAKGSTVYYGLSKGIKSASLPSKTDINNIWVGSNPVSAENTQNLVSTKLSDKGFTNVTYKKEKSDKTVGLILNITVNGNEHTNAQTYPVDAAIVVTICNSN